MGETSAAKAGTATLRIPELVAFIATLIALNAVAIDMMLPALTSIGDDLEVAHENDVQLVVLVYTLSSGVAQLFYGPLADRFGRRPVLLFALGGYVCAAALSVVAASFSMLLIARLLQGLTTGANRVVGTAVVRDMCSGRKMAEVMSLALTVFMIAPIVAPSVGQLVLTFSSWRGLFGILTLAGVAVWLWTFLRLPETLTEEKRRPLAAGKVAAAFAEVVRHRVPLGYTIASALMFSAPMAYLSSANQIFTETFGLGPLFPIAFGAVALSLAAASILNARLVGRYGMRLISHVATLAFAAFATLHALVAASGHETLASFMILQMIVFLAIGMMMSNFSALALEPLGHVAGVASSVLGFATLAGAAVIGGFIARFYDGSSTPLAVGFAVMGISTLLVVLATERGRLFRGGARLETEAA